MSETKDGGAVFRFKAQPGPYSSVLGASVHIIADDGRFLGQIAFLCHDDELRNPAIQGRLTAIIAHAINAARTGGSRMTVITNPNSAHFGDPCVNCGMPHDAVLPGPCPGLTQLDQWDEATRGKKMSDASGKVIFKYQMPVLEHFTMKLPKGAQIIRMADQGGMFWLWAVVDTRLPDEERQFYAVKCGANVPEIPGLYYHGFCAIHVQQELGLYIFEDMSHAAD